MTQQELVEMACELEELVSEGEEPPVCECPICGSLNYAIGVLGNREAYSCRNCGMEYGRTIQTGR